MLAHKQKPSPSTRDTLLAARSKAQQTAHRSANEYWQNLYSKTQLSAGCGHAKGMYEGIKTATGPTSVKTAPFQSKTGEVITDQSMQLQRWVEHYLELYSTQNIVTDTALNALPGLPVIEELENTPTLEELSIAIDGLACGKAAGKDGIPLEVLKHGKQTIIIRNSSHIASRIPHVNQMEQKKWLPDVVKKCMGSKINYQFLAVQID